MDLEHRPRHAAVAAAAAFVATAALIAAWSAAEAADARCTDTGVLSCIENTLGVLVLGTPVALLVLYPGFRWAGVRSPALGTWLVVSTMCGLPALVFSVVEPPAVGWPFAAGIVAAAYVRLEARASGDRSPVSRS